MIPTTGIDYLRFFFSLKELIKMKLSFTYNDNKSDTCPQTD